MGAVYRARDSKLNRDVAIKVLLPAVANDPDRLARFSREAQVLASLNHPNIAQIHGIEESNGVTALVMELVDGEDLSQRIARGPIPLADALAIARQIAEALEAAHDQGIIHRDLKPANLFLTRRPDGSALVKVLDFGVSKALHDEALSGVRDQVTVAHAMLGSPHYMSPEQIRNSTAVDARSDLWALGMILHELITGSPAYSAETLPALLAMIIADPPMRLRTGEPAAPAELERLVLHCLEKDRERRCASVAALAHGLAPFASDEARSSVERISRILGDDGRRVEVASATRRRRTVLLVGAASLCAIVAGGAVWTHSGSVPPRSRSVDAIGPGASPANPTDAAAAADFNAVPDVPPTPSAPVGTPPTTSSAAAPGGPSAPRGTRASPAPRPAPPRAASGRKDDLFEDAK